MNKQNVYQCRMSYAQWCALPSNPTQRDTEKHARGAYRTYLRESANDHMIVKATERNGILSKLDGHTRTWLWEHDLLPKPEILFVSVLKCASAEEEKEAYYLCDNKRAAKTAADTLSGICRAEDIVLESSRLKDGGFKAALDRAVGAVSHRGVGGAEELTEKVQDWKPEICLLDKLVGRAPKNWHGAVLASILVTLRHFGDISVKSDGETILDFWDRVKNDQGTKENRKDAVQAAWETIQMKRPGGYEAWDDLMGRLLSCAIAFTRGETYIRGPKKTDIAPYQQRSPAWARKCETQRFLP